MRFKALFVGLFGLAAAACASQEAFAFGANMCFPDPGIGQPGPRTVYNNSVVGSTQIGQSANNPYMLGVRGCAYIYAADIPWAQSQGALIGGQIGVITYLTGVQTGTTAFQVGNLPANTFIQNIAISNLTANAITGGLNFGNVSGGAQYVSALAVVASAVKTVPDASYALRVIAGSAGNLTTTFDTAAQPLWINAVTSFNSANLAITVTYQYF